MSEVMAGEKRGQWLERGAELLQRYLRINTVNPPGDVRKAIEWFSGIFSAAGVEHRAYVADEAAGKVNLLARLPAQSTTGQAGLRGSGKGRPLLLLNHIDVVPVEAEKWDVDPFGGVVKDGCIWGRGALDMKSMGIAELMAVLRLAEEKTPLARDVLWLGVCDEEIGGILGAKWMVERHWDDLQAEFVLDEGGGGTRGLLLPDARVVFAPSVNEKEPLWLKLSVAGEGGHGSMPHDNNPAEVLAQALGRLMAARAAITEAADHPVVAEMRKRLGAMAANRYTDAITRHTISLTSVHSGVGVPPKVNVIPTEAVATLDCRLLPGMSHDAFLKKVTAALGDARINVERIDMPSQPCKTSTTDTVLFKAIEAAIREHMSEALVTPQLLPGATDSRFFRLKGASAYGFEPAILDPGDIDQIHGHNERIRLTEFHRMIQLVFDVVRRVATSSG